MGTLDYYKQRNVTDSFFLNFIKEKKELTGTSIFVDGDEYCIYYLCGVLNENLISAQELNENVGTDVGDIITIGLVEGDDILCMNLISDEIFIKLIENGDGEIISVSDSFQNMLQLLM